jgi:hypothetical protein
MIRIIMSFRMIYMGGRRGRRIYDKWERREVLPSFW